jgi:CubicO group peptidase (beta-lactamase class C family)
VAIVQDGEVAYTGGFGVSDRESGEAVTPETLMMIGSTTKPLTTMLMASLVDDGVFTWDTPAVEILPSFRVSDPELSRQITMRNLVCACTGVPRRDFEWLFNADELDAMDIVNSVADFEFFTDFGEAFQYSNQMVATGGYLATLAAGGEEATLLEDYEALLQARILDPIGMSASTFDFEAVANNGNHATPYGQTPLGETIPLPLSTEAVLLPVAPAGALWSNVGDLANFVITNLDEGVAPDGTRVVSAENLAVTWKPQVEITADASYGLGWIVEEYKGLQILSHAGNTFGFTSELAFVPEADLGIVILTNQRVSSLNQIVRVRLLELLYDQPSEVDELLQFSLQQGEEARQELEASLTALDANAIAPYLGDYENESLGTMSLAWQDDALVMDVGEFQAEIRAVEGENGETHYLTWTPPISGMPLELAKDDEGNPTIIFGSGVVAYTFVKSE